MKRTIVLAAALIGMSSAHAMSAAGHASVSAAHASVSAHPSASAHPSESAHAESVGTHVSSAETAHVSAPAPRVPTRPVTTTTYPWWLFGHAHTTTTQERCDPKKDKDCK